MKLTYHKGNNFGDKLNPYIFEKYLSDFFDDRDDILFLGIGTILGLKRSSKKKIIFSSGVSENMESTYGCIPEIDNTYDIFCVRGPLTARALNIDNSFAVIDGAYLLYDLLQLSNTPKSYKISYIPHVGSESFYNGLKEIFEDVGINYISPTEEVNIILQKISQSEIILAEAMHGAIVADALRIPWIPVKMYKTINEFKWNDWLLSINKTYKPMLLPSLYNKELFDSIISNKMRLPSFIRTILYQIFQTFNKQILKIKLKRTFNLSGNLSDEKLVALKVEILKSKLNDIKLKYQ